MKKNLLFSLRSTILLLTVSTNISGQTLSSASANSFIHPAILNSKASLDFIAAEANAGNTQRVAAFQKVLDHINSKSYPTSFPSVVAVGSNGGSSPSKDQIRKDAELVYATALRFAKTADMTYAKQAINILNGWAYAFQKYTVLSASDDQHQPSLEASWTTPSFVAAAEIIRYYKPKGVSANWSSADIAQFIKFITTVKDNYIEKTPVYNNNWNVSAGYAEMAVGVFLDDNAVFQKGINMIKAVLPKVILADGTLPELCGRKDCKHYQYSLTGVTFAAELANMQGDNSLYTALSNRISAGYDYMRKAYNQTVSGCDYCSGSSPMFGGVEIAYNYYKTANMLSLRNQGAPIGVPADNTFLGFTTYTHYKVTIPTAVDNEEVQHPLSVFPNPTSGVFSIKFNTAIGLNAEVSITNLLGRELYKGIFTGSEHIDLTGMNAGVYMISISAGENKWYEKLIKY